MSPPGPVGDGEAIFVLLFGVLFLILLGLAVAGQL